MVQETKKKLVAPFSFPIRVESTQATIVEDKDTKDEIFAYEVTIKTILTPDDLRELLKSLRDDGKTVAVVEVEIDENAMTIEQ